MPPKKIAIVMYGINRGIHKTYETFKTHVLDPLVANDFEVDIYMHTYKLNSLYSNCWSHETNLKIDHIELINVVTPNKYCVDDQDEVDTLYDIDAYKNCGDPWKNGFVSVKNVVRALYSLKKAWELIPIDIEYDCVMVMRPDIFFLNSLDVKDVVDSINDDHIYVPSFHSCRGFNDRFAFGSKNKMETYCMRYDQLEEYAQNKAPHSETFLKHVIKSAKKTGILFNRTRADGRVENDVHKRTRP